MGRFLGIIPMAGMVPECVANVGNVAERSLSPVSHPPSPFPPSQSLTSSEFLFALWTCLTCGSAFTMPRCRNFPANSAHHITCPHHASNSSVPRPKPNTNNSSPRARFPPAAAALAPAPATPPPSPQKISQHCNTSTPTTPVSSAAASN